MKKVVSIFAAAAVLLAGSCFIATAQSQEHIIQAPDEAKWGPAPPMLPAGAEIAVLAGDPTKAVPYAVRLRLPAHYSIAAHSHPTDEHIVVLVGALTFGMGDKLVKDTAKGKALYPGGFAMMPAHMNHFAYTGDLETTIILYGQGPVEFKYANPADDPRTPQAVR